MRKLFFFLLGVHLLPSQPAAQPDKKYFDGLYNSLAYGRTESVFASLKEAYASAGVHFPDAMILKLQPFNEPLSYYNHDERSIKLSEMMNMPEQGSLYWRNWSNVLTDNKWKPNQHFKDEAEMMLAGNFAILGILAHEMGHAADYQYEIGRFRANDNEDLNNAIKELVADELAVMIMKKLAIDIRFKKLLDQYRDKIITSLRKSAPADRLWELGKPADLFSYCRQNEVPSNTGLYVSYQLARQEFLLRQPLNSYYTTTLLRHCKAKKAVWENTRQYALGKRIIMPVTSGYSINSFLPATVFNVPYLQLNGQKVKWKMEWQRNPEKDTLLQLVNENTPDSTISVSVKPLIDFASRQLNVEFPNRHSAVNDFSYYIWSLIPLAKNEFMALVSNARKIYYSGQRPGITTLYLLQYKTGNDLSIQVADSIRWPAVSELAGGLRQLPGGEIRLFLFHKEADEVAGLYEQYSLDNNYKFKRIVQTKAVHKKFGYNTDGVLAAAQLDWYYIILNGLPDREGNLVFANQSYIKRIRNDKLETLAGTYYPGNRNGDVREQVCNNAKLLWIDTNNQVEFLNCHRVASLQGKDFWELKKLQWLE